MLTDVVRPRVFVLLGVGLLFAAAGTVLWQMRLPLHKSPGDFTNRYLPDRADLEVKPGANAEVYALYLRARELETRQGERALTGAQDLYQEAIAADRTFALAHARLAVVLVRRGGASPAERETARAEAEEALRLDPHLGEAHFARALWFAEDGQYARAIPEVELALARRPDDAEIIYLAASLHRRQGKWKQALAEFQRTVALSPRNPLDGPTDLAYHFSQMRDWPAALAAWDRAVSIVPERTFNRLARTYAVMWATGDVTRGRTVLASFPTDYAGQFKEALAWMRWDFNLLVRDFAAAEKGVDDYPDDPLNGGWSGPLPKSYLRGCIEAAKGNAAAAAPLLADACVFLEKRIEESPHRPIGHAQLALAYAYAGRKEEALRAGLRATELCPEASDAFDGTHMSMVLAIVHAQAGETDKAIAEIQRLLTVPGALNYECSITLNDLRLRWQWDPLRSDPRFQAILDGPEPATIIR